MVPVWGGVLLWRVWVGCGDLHGVMVLECNGYGAMGSDIWQGRTNNAVSQINNAVKSNK